MLRARLGWLLATLSGALPGPVLSQSPHSHHLSEPQFYIPAPTFPDVGMQPLHRPSPGDALESQPSVRGISPPLPPHLMGPNRELPASRTTTAPPELIKGIVAYRVRLTDTTTSPSKLTGVDVEFAKGGYLVTKKYSEDTGSLDFYGKPRYWHWEITSFVSEAEVRVKMPEGGQPPVGTPPPPKTGTPEEIARLDDGEAKKPLLIDPSTLEKQPGKPESTIPARGEEPKPQPDQPHPPAESQPDAVGHIPGPKDLLLGKLDPIPIQPGDISGGLPTDPRVLEEIHESFRGTVINDRFSHEFEASFLEAATKTGQAGLEAGLLVGSQIPGIGTVINGGRTFAEQYNKTYNTLLKGGFDPTEANRQALLQATAVTGVSVAVDVATGSVAGRLKTLVRNPIMNSALHDKKWREASVNKLGQAVDLTVDQAVNMSLIAGGAALRQLGGNGPTATPPAIAYGNNRNGMYFLVP